MKNNNLNQAFEKCDKCSQKELIGLRCESNISDCPYNDKNIYKRKQEEINNSEYIKSKYQL